MARGNPEITFPGGNMRGMTIQFKDEMDAMTYSSTETASSGEIQEAQREICELIVDLSQPKAEHD